MIRGMMMVRGVMMIRGVMMVRGVMKIRGMMISTCSTKVRDVPNCRHAPRNGELHPSLTEAPPGCNLQAAEPLRPPLVS